MNNVLKKVLGVVLLLLILPLAFQILLPVIAIIALALIASNLLNLRL